MLDKIDLLILLNYSKWLNYTWAIITPSFGDWFQMLTKHERAFWVVMVQPFLFWDYFLHHPLFIGKHKINSKNHKLRSENPLYSVIYYGIYKKKKESRLLVALPTKVSVIKNCIHNWNKSSKIVNKICYLTNRDKMRTL